jgi:hypothetical protein
MKATQIGALVYTADENLARERAYYAFRTLRAYLDELEAYAREDELFRESVSAMLEAQSRQLGSLVRVYERACDHRCPRSDELPAAA